MYNKTKNATRASLKSLARQLIHQNDTTAHIPSGVVEIYFRSRKNIYLYRYKAHIYNNDTRKRLILI